MLELLKNINKYSKSGIFYFPRLCLTNIRLSFPKSFCIFNYKSEYTPEEVNKILAAVNEKSSDELLR